MAAAYRKWERWKGCDVQSPRVLECFPLKCQRNIYDLPYDHEGGWYGNHCGNSGISETGLACYLLKLLMKIIIIAIQCSHLPQYNILILLEWGCCCCCQIKVPGLGWRLLQQRGFVTPLRPSAQTIAPPLLSSACTLLGFAILFPSFF